VAGPEAALPMVMSDQRAQTAYTTLVSVPSADAPQLALSLLLDDLEQERGLLYVHTDGTYECVAQRGMQALEGLEGALAEFMQAEIAGSTEVTATVADLANMDTESDSLSGVARSAHFCAPTGERLRFHPLSYVRDGQLWFVAVLVVSEDCTQRERRGDLEPAVAYALAERAEFELVLAAS
jgi:hypothetical protein